MIDEIENNEDIEDKEIIQDDELENNIKDKTTVAENYGMYSILMTVSNDDVNQLDTWMKKPIKMLFTNMRYRNDLVTEMNRNQKAL
jgi:hypothetical protein